jgi:serine/threonine protein kinase
MSASTENVQRPGAETPYAWVAAPKTIPRKDLNVVTSDPTNKIGSGATSFVFKGTWNSTPIAMKVIRSHLGDAAMISLQTELRVLTAYSHDRILIFHGTCRDLHPTEGTVALITDLMERGSLKSILHETTSPNHFTWKPRSITSQLELILDIADGMRFLHARGVLHRDLKSANVLVDKDGRAKIADFGLASFKSDFCKDFSSATGTIPWCAPEILRGDQRINLSADVYSSGVIFWEIFTGELPWIDFGNPPLPPLTPSFSSVPHFTVSFVPSCVVVPQVKLTSEIS